MAENYLIILSSGLDQKDRLIVGMNLAKNLYRKKKANDVKVVFFGPSEKAFSSDDEDFKKLFNILKDIGILVVACNGYSRAHTLDDDILKFNVELEDVSDTIPRYVDLGYKVITF